MLRLVRPSSEFKTSYLAAIAEYHAEYRFIYYQISELRRDFAAHVAAERAWLHPENLTIFRVPETIYWLTEGDEFLGRLELRHHLYDPVDDVAGHIGYSIRPSQRGHGLGTEILRLGLLEASARGMRRVLLTCDPDNTASRRVIERNGGQFEREIDRTIDGIDYHKLRYWIEVARPGAQPGQSAQSRQPGQQDQADERPSP